MSFASSILVKVPATTANMGAGFDCIGMALDLYNDFEFSLSEGKTTFLVEGEGYSKISLVMIIYCIALFFIFINKRG